MSRVNPVSVQEIKASADLREIAARYGFEPTRAGFICCPFHPDGTPSCRVTASRFYCFGCGAHGDVLDFLQQLTGRSFSDCFALLGGRLEDGQDPLTAEREQILRDIARAAKGARRRLLNEKYRAGCWDLRRLRAQAAELTPPATDEGAAELGRILGKIARAEASLDGLSEELQVI